MQTQFTELTDTQWQFIEEILNQHRKRKHNLRDIVNGILELLRTGVQWRNLNHPTLSWQIIYYYFRKWKVDGTLDRLNSSLNEKERKRQHKQETPSLLYIDSQPIKSVQFVSQDKGIDGNKNSNGRKRHLIVDTLGLVWGVVVHAADIHNGVKAHLLVEHCLGYLDRMKKILVDDAYKKVFYNWVQNNNVGLTVEFASKPHTEKGFVPVKWRWVNAAMELKELLGG
jgi:putative transposase